MKGKLSARQCLNLAKSYRWPWHKQYSLAKMLSDPLYAAVAKELLEADDGRTPLLDIGCGIGLLARYLRAAGFRAPIQGFDFDANKIEAAKFVAEDEMSFTLGDAREGLASFQGHVAILDLLQYLQPEQQTSLLQQSAKSVAPRGCLVIRSGLSDDSWRSRVTRWADHFAKAVVWMKSGPVSYPSAAFVAEILEPLGLQGGFRPLWGRTPFNNYLGVFRQVST